MRGLPSPIGRAAIGEGIATGAAAIRIAPMDLGGLRRARFGRRRVCKAAGAAQAEFGSAGPAGSPKSARMAS